MDECTESWEIPATITPAELERIEKLLSVIICGGPRSIRAPTSVRVRREGDDESAAGPSPSMVLLQFPRMPTSVTLHHLVRDYAADGRLTHPVRVQLAVELLSAMAFLHSNGVYHHGLTSDDVMVLPSAIGTEKQCLFVSNLYSASVQASTTAAYVCSRNYRPPEVIFAAGNTVAALVDTWVVGCLLFEICTGQAAFSLLSSKENGSVKPLLLKQQIQQIISSIGSLTAEDFPAGMYTQRHQDVLLGMSGEWKLEERLEAAGVEFASAWGAVMKKCLMFRPDRRPALTDVLRESIFDVSQSALAIATETVHMTTLRELTN